MAYHSGRADGRILLRTVRLTLNASGRSRRSEVIYWWIATGLAGVVLNFGTLVFAPPLAAFIIANLISGILAIPMFALFGRRMHDQNRSGWWALLFPCIVIIGFFDGPDPLFEAQWKGWHPLQWIDALVSIAFLIMLLLPGTIGPNAYGSDPREDDESI